LDVEEFKRDLHSGNKQAFLHAAEKQNARFSSLQFGRF
jgi:hypothetical protein